MKGLVVWLTGLSGAGKTTISHVVRDDLVARGIAVEVLDGDRVRSELTPRLGFTKADRNENVRAVAFVAEMLARHGVVVLVALISPYREARDAARSRSESFIEVFVNAPLPTCEARDTKGLYKLARGGAISHFTGLGDPYEAPLAPDIECRTDLESVEESAAKVLALVLQLKERCTCDSHLQS